MKTMKLSIPSNLNQWMGLAGMALVVLTTLGMHGVWPSWLVPVVGAAIGILAVHDAKAFLLAGLALIGAKWGLNHLPILGNLVQDFATNLTALVAPAMLMVAIRSIYKEIK